MLLTKQKGIIKVTAEKYSLTFAADRPFVYLDDSNGKRLAELFVFSSVQPLHGRDDVTGIRISDPDQIMIQEGMWDFSETPQEICLSCSVDSSVWKRKTYRFRCTQRRFTYEVEVDGDGELCEVNYLGGYCSSQVRWGSGFFWSGQKFQRGFNPEPTKVEINTFAPAEGSVIDLMGVPLPGKDNWFFTPPPFCFAFEGYTDWIGVGVEAQPGGYTFTEYAYHGRNGGFYLSLSYEGHTHVLGSCQLPAIGFDFEASEYDALAAHVKALPKPTNQPVEAAEQKKPAWWHEPIYCGWGSQCYLAGMKMGRKTMATQSHDEGRFSSIKEVRRQPGTVQGTAAQEPEEPNTPAQYSAAPDFSTQANYENFLETLEAHGVYPGIIVLDDKWQAVYGDNQPDLQKWPDLPAFIQDQHDRGRKVLLWLKAWDPEGVPVEECITNAAGLPLAVDPSNPAFEKRLRQSVHTMLSPDGYDADGFKIDFTARIPSGPGICAYGEIWGLELMKSYLSIIYHQAKRSKKDALVMAHTPHPYLADVLDMIRLNDINPDRDVCEAMTFRARIAAIACPDAIIDTDNWPIKDRASWRRYVQMQPELGVPSLYYASHIDSTREPLEEKDYQLIREVWARHRSRKGLKNIGTQHSWRSKLMQRLPWPVFRQRQAAGEKKQ